MNQKETPPSIGARTVFQFEINESNYTMKSMERKGNLSIDQIKEAARGRELDVLREVAGIPAEYLDKKGHPCPKCGEGDDRFSLIAPDRGAVFCRHCFNKESGDFIEAVRHFRGVDRREALRLIADYLALAPKSPAPKEKKQSRQNGPDSIPVIYAGDDAGSIYRPWLDTKGLSEESFLANGGTVIKCWGQLFPALPRYDPASDLSEPCRWTLFDQHGKQKSKVVPKDGPGTFAPKALIGLHGLWNIHSAELVIKVEGPTDLLRLWEAVPPEKRDSIAVISNANGAAETPLPETLTLLDGKTVLIVGDADEPGEHGAFKWAQAIASKAGSVEVVKLPYPVTETKGKDIRDYFDAGAKFSDFLSLDREAVESSPPPPAGKEEKTVRPPLEWEPFPVEVFPEPIQRYVIESAGACGVDPGYVAPLVLSAVSSMIGSAYRIRLKDGWDEPSSIWTALVAESGSGKSPALDAAVGPIREFQQRLDEEYRESLEEFEREKMQFEVDLAKWKKKGSASDSQPERPAPPIPSTLLVDDTTVEAVAEITEDNPCGVLLPKDELSGWLGCFDAYKNGSGSKDLSFWLSVHGVRYFRSNRKTGKKLVIAKTPAVAICGGIQNGMLKKILVDNEHFFDSGLAARILFAMPPDKPVYWTENTVSGSTAGRYRLIFKTFLDWRDDPEKPSPNDPCIIRLSERALLLFVQFYNANVDQRAELSGNLRAFWPKLTGYAGRIALCFHMIRCAESGVLTTMLEPETMESAIAVVQWFKREAARIVETVRGEVCEIDFESQAVLDAIQRNGGEITVRELQHSRRVYRNSGGAGLAEKKLRKMVKAGILEVHFEQGSRGPGKDVFRLNQAGSGNRFEENTGENAKPVTVTTDIFSENDFPERSPNTTPPAALNEPPRYQF